jgi:hypothetical protein
VVRHAREADLLRTAAIAALAACALALAACGGSGGSGRSGGRTIPVAAGTSPARFDPAPFLATFTCRQWRVAKARTRASVVRALHAFYGSPVASNGKVQGYGTVLSNQQALALFDTTCRRSFAAAFTLYKLYARAAAFAGQAP